MDKQKAIIFDVDGTLADCEHRRHFVSGHIKNWEAFFQAMVDDSPKWSTLALLKSFCEAQKMLIIFVTGRPERYRSITNNWLMTHTGYLCGHLFMRPDGDTTPDEVFKKKVYDEQIKPFYDVMLVVDDRSKVVKMWRSEGLECWQVDEGDF